MVTRSAAAPGQPSTGANPNRGPPRPVPPGARAGRGRKDMMDTPEQPASAGRPDPEDEPVLPVQSRPDPEDEPALPVQSREDTDAGWGARPSPTMTSASTGTARRTGIRCSRGPSVRGPIRWRGRPDAPARRRDDRIRDPGKTRARVSKPMSSGHHGDWICGTRGQREWDQAGTCPGGTERSGPTTSRAWA